MCKSKSHTDVLSEKKKTKEEEKNVYCTLYMYLEKKRERVREKKETQKVIEEQVLLQKKRKIDVIYIVNVTLPLNSHYLRK